MLLEQSALMAINVANNNRLNLGLRVKCPIFLPDVNLTWNFDRFSQKYPIQNFTETHPMGTTLIYVNGQTDMMNTAGTFCDYANVPKNEGAILSFFFFTEITY
jgi:hypothetical protein